MGIMGVLISLGSFTNVANAPQIGGPVYADTGGQLILAVPLDMGGVLLGKYIIMPAAKFLSSKLRGAFTSTARSAIGKGSGEASVNIGARTSKLITEGPGVNVTPVDNIFNPAYTTIGRNGRTYVTDLQAIEDVIGNFRNVGSEVIEITPAQLQQLKQVVGRELASQNVISIVDDIASRAPGAPMTGNAQFIGAGKGLPSGAPELTIDGIGSGGGPGITRYLIKVKGG
jgi:hypothetical protein